MKSLACIILATLLSACAGMQFDKDLFEAGMNYRNGNPPQQQFTTQVQMPPRQPQLEFSCFSNCTQSGYMYNFCRSKCSY